MVQAIFIVIIILNVVGGTIYGLSLLIPYLYIKYKERQMRIAEKKKKKKKKIIKKKKKKKKK